MLFKLIRVGAVFSLALFTLDFILLCFLVNFRSPSSLGGLLVFLLVLQLPAPLLMGLLGIFLDRECLGGLLRGKGVVPNPHYSKDS
jgi:hypothetical protein